MFILFGMRVQETHHCKNYYSNTQVGTIDQARTQERVFDLNFNEIWNFH